MVRSLEACICEGGWIAYRVSGQVWTGSGALGDTDTSLIPAYLGSCDSATLGEYGIG